MLVPILLFALGLVLLIKGGDWFVDGATGIAHRFHLPELLIGATVVSIGTTLPEVMVSTSSAAMGHGQLSYGNAIGSIICNTSLICALTLIASPGLVDRKALRTPVIFFALTTAIYVCCAYFFRQFTRPLGFVLLAVFLIYMVVTVRQALRSSVRETLEARKADTAEAAAAAPAAEPEEGGKQRTFIMEVVLLVIGAALIAVGADLLVDNGVIIAEALGVPESVIGLTFVALGTSLPELVTAVTSIIKKHASLSLGNIIGANLFNLVLVSGMSIAINPFGVPDAQKLFGWPLSLVVDLPVMLLVSCILLVPSLVRGRIARWQGIALLACYAAFCVLQFTIL